MNTHYRCYADGSTEERSVLCLIPARGGSKRIPGKNLVTLGGKPLIAWTIECVKEAGFTPYVSTDSEAIASISKAYGAEVIDRPPDLASDTSSSEAVAKHALQQVPADVLVLLQPTSPFRTSQTILKALDMFNGNPVVTVNKVEHQDWHYQLSRDGMLLELPGIYRLNGCVYVVGSKYLQTYKSFTFMSRALELDERESVDIDTLADLDRARQMAGEKLAA